jgi:CubicO group peptidase (beta-lactamase class C family)
MKSLASHTLAAIGFVSILIALSGCSRSSSSVPPASLTVQPPFEQDVLSKDSLETFIAHFPEGTQLSIGWIQDSVVQFWGIERQSDDYVAKQNEERLFEIGSITKTFTALLLAEALADSLVSLDEPILNDLPELKPDLEGRDAISFEHLATHTSGLPRIPMQSGLLLKALFSRKNPLATYSEEDLLEYLANDLVLDNPPGEVYAYSNLGYSVLGLLLSKRLEKPYDQLVKERVFQPLGMAASRVHWSDELEEQMVSGQTAKGKTAPPWLFDVMAPAGSIRSNAVDMVKYLQAQWEGPASWQECQRIHFSDQEGKQIGLGWHVAASDDRIRWHNGGTGGYRSMMAFQPEARTGVIILSNVSSSHPNNQNIDLMALSWLDGLLAGNNE